MEQEELSRQLEALQARLKVLQGSTLPQNSIINGQETVVVCLNSSNYKEE